MLGLVTLIALSQVKALSLTCPAYKCNKTNLPNQSSCSYLNITSNITYVNPCKDDYICMITSSTTSQCQYKSSYTANSQVSGAKCSYNQDCTKSNTCIQNTCHGLSINAPCKSHLDCDIGLFCTLLNMTCIPQLKKGQLGCYEDANCVNNAGCQVFSQSNPENNVCTEYFSIEDYEVLTGCNTTGDVNYLCKSGFCVDIGTSLCYPAPISEKKTPISCTNNTVCISKLTGKAGQVFTTGCSCGLNSESDMFCNIFPGDDVYNDYDSMVRDWITSGNIMKCNTYGRFGSSCMKSYWSDSKYKEFVRKMYKALYYPRFVNAEECALQMAFPEYYEFLDKGFGDLIALGGMIAFLIA